MEYYEEEKNFRPVYNTAISLLRSRGKDIYCQLVQDGEVNVVNTEYDNWNGGIYGYTVFVNLPVKVYASLQKNEIETAEAVIGETLNEVIKGNNNDYFNVQISPMFTVSDIDWTIIGGESAKEQLKNNLDAIKDILVSVSTGGPRFQEVEDRYKKLQGDVSKKFKQLNITYNNQFVSLWDWYGRYKSELPTYQSRREFVQELLKPTYEAFLNDASNSSFAAPIVELDDWERIKRTVLKIKQDSGKAQNEEDFQQVGLLCREVIISLAQAVYNPIFHGTTDENGTTIGKTDAVRMIKNYINVRLAGQSNEELRKYAKVTNDLTNMLTHKRDADKMNMLITVSATIALINFIGVLESKF